MRDHDLMERQNRAAGYSHLAACIISTGHAVAALLRQLLGRLCVSCILNVRVQASFILIVSFVKMRTYFNKNKLVMIKIVLTAFYLYIYIYTCHIELFYLSDYIQEPQCTYIYIYVCVYIYRTVYRVTLTLYDMRTIF